MATRLYVGNLPQKTTDDDLRELFAPHGTVASSTVVVDRNTGRSRGFALVEMDDGVDAALAATDGLPFQGRVLSVSRAVVRPAPVPLVRLDRR